MIPRADPEKWRFGCNLNFSQKLGRIFFYVNNDKVSKTLWEGILIKPDL